MNAPALDEIDARLYALPPSLRLSSKDSRAIARLEMFKIQGRPRGRHPARLVAGLAAALALLIVGDGFAAYYAPRYGQVLAQMPLLGGINAKLLDFYGLTEQNVTVVNDSSTSSGHTVRLVAGYADGLRTVLYVEIDGRGLTGNPKVYGRHLGDYGVGAERGLTLTDQFGHSYKLAGASSTSLFQFEPLVWPASSLGARLTLHITYLQKLWLEGAGQDRELSGDWALHATLVAEPVHVLPLPSPVRTTNAVYTFTSLRVTSTAVHLEWTTTGALIDDPRLSNHGSLAEAQLFRDYFLSRLFDSAGHETPSSTSAVTFSRPVKTEFTGYVHGPGRYRLQLGDALTQPAYEVWIVVP
jgi:hypothetical protein